MLGDQYMVDDLRRVTGAGSCVWPAAGDQSNSYAGINTDRRSRFEARCDRRWGDWSVLGFPTAVLWMEYPYLPLIYAPWAPTGEIVVDIGIWGDAE
jgi:hypothetical protein